jgi:hypothetical protein
MTQSVLDIILRTKKTGTGAKDAEQELSGLQKSVAKFGDMAKGAAVAGVDALVAGLSYAVDQALETERVMRATEQVIRSTGGAAGLTADEIADMAGQMSALTGIDDEAIQSAENVLLTFTSIGRDVFPQATQAALDMSAALGTDLQGAVTMIGKALQDPVQGVSALARVGVNFSESAKETIQRMVEMNDVAGAQAFILKELNTEFGGMAEALGDTAAGKINKARNAIDNMAASIGEKLLPVLGEAADAAVVLITWNDKMEQAVRGVSDALLSSTPNWEDYARGVLGAAVNAGFMTQAMVEQYIATGKVTAGFFNEFDITQKILDQTGLLTQAKYEEARAAKAQEQASVEAAARSATAQAEAAEQVKAATDAHAAKMRELQIEYENQRAAALAAAEAEVVYRAGVAETTGQIEALAQSLMKATDAQAKQMLAQANLDALSTAYKEGTISQEDFQQATDAVLLRYDLATPKSLAMAEAQQKVTDAFIAGELPLQAFITSSEKIPDIAADGEVTMKELTNLGIKPTTAAAKDQTTQVKNLKAEWDKIPRSVKTVYTIKTEGHIPNVPSDPERAGGGPVIERVPIRMNELYRERFVPYAAGSMMPASHNVGPVSIVVNPPAGTSVHDIARAVSIELARMSRARSNAGVSTL